MNHEEIKTLREAGMVYVVHATGSNFYKIGWTKKEPEKRISQLQVGCPYELNLVKLYIGTEKDEKQLHLDFVSDRYRGEWFVFSDQDAFDIFGYKKKNPKNLFKQQRKRQNKKNNSRWLMKNLI